MLKKAMFDTDQKFLNNLAGIITSPIVTTTVADDKEDAQKKVTDAAKAYWMLGWSWEEIEAILLDTGDYEEKQVEKAVEETKQYAQDTLKDGPFSSLKYGQKVKLTNGNLAQLVAKSKDDFVVSQDGDNILVHANFLDIQASKLLAKSYELRNQAEAILKKAQTKEYDIPEPTKSDKPEVSPEVSESYKTLRHEKQAPAGWSDIAPEIGETQPVKVLTGKIINNLDGLKSMKDEVQAKIKEIKDSIKPLADNIKELEKEEQDELKHLFLVVGEMEEGLDGMDKVIFRDYQGKIVGFRRKIVEDFIPPNVQDELEALKKILSENHPKIAKSVFDALQKYTDSATIVERTVENTFAKFPYRQKPKKGQKTAQLFEKFTNLLAKLWDKVKTITNRLFETVFPKAEETTSAIQNTMDAIDAASVDSAVKEATKKPSKSQQRRLSLIK